MSDTSLTDAKERAQALLSDPDAPSKLRQQVMETLLTHLEIEAEEGSQTGETDKERVASRQSRKQHKELAELLLALIPEVKK